jgi:hypothetical protein
MYLRKEEGGEGRKDRGEDKRRCAGAASQNEYENAALQTPKKKKTYK